MEKMYFLNLKEEEVYLNLVMNYSPETIYTLQRKLSKKKEVLVNVQTLQQLYTILQNLTKPYTTLQDFNRLYSLSLNFINIYKTL